MSFNSLAFLCIFLPVALLAYYVVPRKAKNLCLFLFSLVFYAWGVPAHVLILLGTIVVDYVCGLLISHFSDSKGKARLFTALNIVVNVGMLGYFKYTGMIVTSLNGFGMDLAVPEIALPLGISFYTFQSISYAVDVYRKEVPAMRNFIDFGTYISCFINISSGPIARYSLMYEQIKSRKETAAKFTVGGSRFLLGLFKKMLIANTMLELSQRVQYMEAPSTLSAWLGVLAFTFYIYFDFSGYTDMAIGIGGMFGFELPENFHYPYASKSFSEFWRRWHMTLGRWFRDYVYIPLGGNRVKKPRLVFNLAVVWILTGIWHGASWNFALWGAYCGILIICEKLFLQKLLDKLPAFFQWLYAFLAAVIGWVFFAYADLSKAGTVLAALVGFTAPGAEAGGPYLLITFGPMLVVAALCSSPLILELANRLKSIGVCKVFWVIGYAVLLALCAGAMLSNAYTPFLYAANF